MDPVQNLKRLAAAEGTDYIYAIHGDNKLYKHFITPEGGPAASGWELVYDGYCKDIFSSFLDGMLWCLDENDVILEYNSYTKSMDVFLKLDEPAKRIVVNTTTIVYLTVSGAIKAYDRLPG